MLLIPEFDFFVGFSDVAVQYVLEVIIIIFFF